MEKVEFKKKKRVVRIGNLKIPLSTLIGFFVVLVVTTFIIACNVVYQKQKQEYQKSVEKAQKANDDVLNNSDLYNTLVQNYDDNDITNDFYKGMVGYHVMPEINNINIAYVVCSNTKHKSEVLVDYYYDENGSYNPKIGTGIYPVELNDSEQSAFEKWSANSDKNSMGYSSKVTDGDWSIYLVEPSYNGQYISVPFKDITYNPPQVNEYYNYFQYYGYPTEWVRKCEKYNVVKDLKSKFWDDFNYNQRIICYNDEMKKKLTSIKNDPSDLSPEDAKTIAEQLQNSDTSNIMMVRVVGVNKFYCAETWEQDRNGVDKMLKDKGYSTLDDSVKFTKALYRIYYGMDE